MFVFETRHLDSVDGFDLRVDLVPDHDSESRDSPYGVIVTASKEGIDLGSDSLWMTDGEGFYASGEEFIHGYGPDLIQGAIEQAKSALTSLTKETARGM